MRKEEAPGLVRVFSLKSDSSLYFWLLAGFEVIGPTLVLPPPDPRPDVTVTPPSRSIPARRHLGQLSEDVHCYPLFLTGIFPPFRAPKTISGTVQ